jgi:hypothetical protein
VGVVDGSQRSKEDVQYSSNNWKKVDNNETLNKIDSKGGAIWISNSSEVCYRFSENGNVIKLKDNNQINMVFSNYLDKEVFLLKAPRGHNTEISPLELKMVHADIFEPFNNKEFFEIDELCYRNIFKPSKYLLTKKKNIAYNSPRIEAISKLIKHLVAFDQDREEYLINWIAYFFNGLKKSQVALVLRGNQGAGKGIFFNEVIKPLFGDEYCKTINDKSLQTSYLGGIVENVLFFNLDEISHKKADSQNMKNFLKALITNDTITAEKKFETLDKETNIYGQVLITSNESYVLDIEQSDRRYTIFTTGDNLSYSNYLGYGSYEELSIQIKNELNDFSQYLKNYEVNEKLANQALNTPEKQELQKINIQNENEKRQRLLKGNNRVLEDMQIHPTIVNFSNAIRRLECRYFYIIKFENKSLYEEIIDDMEHSQFRIKNLLKAFQILHGEELKIKRVVELIHKLIEFDPIQFSPENYKVLENGDDIIKIKVYTPDMNQGANIYGQSSVKNQNGELNMDMIKQNMK